MIVKNISLKNFRNYENEKIDFSPSVNIIYGKNAQGKTNVLEGIYLFSMGKSNRTYHDEELIKFGENEATLNMNFIGGKREISAEIIIKKNSRKRVLINEIPVKKNSDLVGKFNVCYFGPECMNIIKSGPSARRKNLDILISQLRKNYFSNLSEYKKATESKNSLLKSEIVDKITLDILNEKLISLCFEIVKYRFLYIKKIEEIANKIQCEISKGRENIEIKYSSNFGIIEEFDDEKIKQKIKEKFENNFKKEVFLKEIFVGCHRDDLEYFINGKNVKNFGSSGQQKTVALVQKIAEVYLIYEEIGEYPVLLLD
ncbi:MAG: DNA replication/repair protein RecF, partial [Clostridia bacterium]|nr:DNA replication/repair protein RecF [Clostridia bacterium]